MSEHEIEIGAVEPHTDDRVDQVQALLILKLEQGDTYAETAAAVISMLDRLAAPEPVDEDDDDDLPLEERLQNGVLYGSLAAAALALALLAAAAVLGVLAIWTPDGTELSGNYATTAVVAVLAAAVAFGIGAVLARVGLTTPDDGGAS